MNDRLLNAALGEIGCIGCVYRSSRFELGLPQNTESNPLKIQRKRIIQRLSFLFVFSVLALCLMTVSLFAEIWGNRLPDKQTGKQKDRMAAKQVRRSLCQIVPRGDTYLRGCHGITCRNKVRLVSQPGPSFWIYPLATAAASIFLDQEEI